MPSSCALLMGLNTPSWNTDRRRVSTYWCLARYGKCVHWPAYWGGRAITSARVLTSCWRFSKVLCFGIAFKITLFVWTKLTF